MGVFLQGHDCFVWNEVKDFFFWFERYPEN